LWRNRDGGDDDDVGLPDGVKMEGTLRMVFDGVVSLVVVETVVKS
jgi:hypothetical protein